MKQDVIEIYRYIRFEDPLYVSVHDNEIDPHSGVTFLIVLDYVKNILRYTLSVCDKENFVKARGREVAKKRMDEGNFIEFQLNKLQIPREGSVSYAIELTSAFAFRDDRRAIPMLEYCGIDDFKKLISFISRTQQNVFDLTTEDEAVENINEFYDVRRRSRVLRCE